MENVQGKRPEGLTTCHDIALLGLAPAFDKWKVREMMAQTKPVETSLWDPWLRTYTILGTSGRMSHNLRDTLLCQHLDNVLFTSHLQQKGRLGMMPTHQHEWVCLQHCGSWIKTLRYTEEACKCEGVKKKTLFKKGGDFVATLRTNRCMAIHDNNGRLWIGNLQ